MHGSTTEHILERLLEDNEQLARHNRDHFDKLGVLAVNFMSAPGAGKTTLIGATVNALRDRYRSAVIEGDMAGDIDTRKLIDQGISAFQITTGRSCHLDAQMIAQFLHRTKLLPADLLLIENVGNLVCPAEFPLGEHKRVVLLSVAEGDDKPLKYPVIFHNCDAVILTKSDLLPYLDFKPYKVRERIKDLNPRTQVFVLSVVSGRGLPLWIEWLIGELNNHQKKVADAGNEGNDGHSYLGAV